MSMKKMNFRFGSFEVRVNVNRNEKRRRERALRVHEHELRLKDLMNDRIENYEFGSCDMYR